MASEMDFQKASTHSVKDLIEDLVKVSRQLSIDAPSDDRNGFRDAKSSSELPKLLDNVKNRLDKRRNTSQDGLGDGSRLYRPGAVQQIKTRNDAELVAMEASLTAIKTLAMNAKGVLSSSGSRAGPTESPKEGSVATPVSSEYGNEDDTLNDYEYQYEDDTLNDCEYQYESRSHSKQRTGSLKRKRDQSENPQDDLDPARLDSPSSISTARGRHQRLRMDQTRDDSSEGILPPLRYYTRQFGFPKVEAASEEHDESEDTMEARLNESQSLEERSVWETPTTPSNEQLSTWSQHDWATSPGNLTEHGRPFSWEPDSSAESLRLQWDRGRSVARQASRTPMFASSVSKEKDLRGGGHPENATPPFNMSGQAQLQLEVAEEQLGRRRTIAQRPSSISFMVPTVKDRISTLDAIQNGEESAILKDSPNAEPSKTQSLNACSEDRNPTTNAPVIRGRKAKNRSKVPTTLDFVVFVPRVGCADASMEGEWKGIELLPESTATALRDEYKGHYQDKKHIKKYDQIKRNATTYKCPAATSALAPEASAQKINDAKCIGYLVIVKGSGPTKRNWGNRRTCATCLDVGRPCTIVVQPDDAVDELKLGILPIPNEEREGKVWTDLGFWLDGA